MIANENGGSVAESFMFPAVLTGVTSDMRIYNEEQFGPVIPVIKFKNISEPIEYMVKSNVHLPRHDRPAGESGLQSKYK